MENVVAFADLFEALSELIILTASRCLHGKYSVTEKSPLRVRMVFYTILYKIIF